MKKIIARFIFVVFAHICVNSVYFAQIAKIDAFQIRKSALVEQIRALKTANPKVTSAELADAANILFDKNGLAFSFLFDLATCDRLRKIKEQQKDPSAPLKLGATLKSVDAEGAALSLPEPSFVSAECGGCYIELPVLQVTDKDFVTVIDGKNIRFHRPSNFTTHEAVLLDAKDETTVKRKWRIPFRAMPIGVTHDENVLYVGFEEPELAELSLLVFGEGVFQIGTRADAENGGKGKLLESPVGLNQPGRKIRFQRWANTYLVGYQNACTR